MLLGYFFWQSLDEALAIAKRGTLALGGTVAVVIGLVAGYRYLRDRASRAWPPESLRSSDPPPTGGARSDGASPDAKRGRERRGSASALRLQVGSKESS